jgi:hypothetical protein
MVLAAYGTYVEEDVLEAEARLDPTGTEIGELERLAREFGLVAEIEEVTVDQFPQLLAEGKLAIAYIDRAVFDLTPRQRASHSLRRAKMHTVVPTRLSATSIWYNDPLPPSRARRTIDLFQSAYDRLGSHCIVCAPPAEA